ncbi:cerebellin-4-like [Alosa pseudoharengus]|uniref:cerebellin-4-like n=1 Tax=Alosa pseudoharengus TaxID=34774 RepID=UPI003F8A3560
MMKTALSVPLLLLLLPLGALCGGPGDVQETRALQQVDDVQEVRARVKREDNNTPCQENLDSKMLKLQMEELKVSLTALKCQLEEQKKTGSTCNTEKVAFGAALGPDGNRGPFGNDITLVYKVVFANVGNAYSPTTGIFTAPVKGVYYFSFSGHNVSSRGMGLRLFKNDKQTVTVYNHPAGSRFETATNGMNLELEKGDQVCMKLRANSWIYDNANDHSTFIGQLLFPL